MYRVPPYGALYTHSYRDNSHLCDCVHFGCLWLCELDAKVGKESRSPVLFVPGPGNQLRVLSNLSPSSLVPPRASELGGRCQTADDGPSRSLAGAHISDYTCSHPHWDPGASLYLNSSHASIPTRLPREEPPPHPHEPTPTRQPREEPHIVRSTRHQFCEPPRRTQSSLTAL